jgi:inhibitor of KinA sporulation pathway (predicted exonuclease)|tara:strand:+ start:181 stop:504 length:324 start_codon:yes stop_codon:yes gene_type:complete
MKNYKAMKSAKSWSVKKTKVVDSKAVSEVKDDDGKVVRAAQAEQSHSELQLVKKQFDGSTGKAMDDSVQSYSLEQVASDITRMKADIKRMQGEQADMEELEKDLKAL